MSEDIKLDNEVDDAEEAAILEAAQLEAAQNQAKQLGVKFHPNMKLPKLQNLIKKHLEKLEAGEDEPEPAPIKMEIVSNEETPEQRAKREAKQRDIQRKRALELTRVRITCMNPNKKDWNGEIFSIANKNVKVKRFIPFGAEWHVEKILLNLLESKQCQMYRTVTRRDGNKVREGYLVPEFSIQHLPPLTQEEMNRIAVKQAAQSEFDD